jgi:hypothetical protein
MSNPRARAAVRLAGFAIAATIGFAPVPAAASMPTTSDARTTVVAGHPVDVASLPAASSRLASRQRADAAVVRGRLFRRQDAPVNVRGTPVPHWTTGPVTEGFSAVSVAPLPVSFAAPLDVTAAVLGSRLVGAGNDLIQTWSTAGDMPAINAWGLVDFFDIPGGQYYFGGVVAASIYRGRFIAVVPTFDDQSASCAHGWLQIAVSSSGDPAKPWTVFRVPIADAFTDVIRIGVSDDKVVLAGNEWDLDAGQPDCIGGAFEGSRIRVMDWVDLIDKGTLTVRDVSPTPRTDYYSWMPASNVPGTATTASGATLRLVGERYAGEWGHLAYAYVTGSAKAGTAALGGNTDLTVTRSVRRFLGPPGTILAFPSGNGGEDTGVASSVAQGGRLWLGANDDCRLDPSPDFHACARFVILDTTVAPPAVVDDGDFATTDDDTFHPQVGLSRDGTVFYAMARSSAVSRAPIDEYLAYRSSADTLAGPDEAIVWKGEETYEHTIWSTVGSLVPDPIAGGQAWVIYPTSTFQGSDQWATASRVDGGLRHHPTGYITIGKDNGWTTGFINQLHLFPDPTSPIEWVRLSASSDVEDTGHGPRLLHGVDLPSAAATYADLADPDLGGTGTGDLAIAFVQWQTGDGTWSVPTSAEATIDAIPPHVDQFSAAFAPGTVGTTVPIRLAWDAHDDESGIARIVLNEYRSLPTALLRAPVFGPAVRSTIRTDLLDGKYQYLLQVWDVAGGLSQPGDINVRPRAAQETSTGISYSGTWSKQTSPSYLGGSTRYSTQGGARFKYTFTGRAVAFVSTKAASRGKAEIYIDGVKVTTIDLYSSTTKYRQIVWQTHWDAVATHDVQVRVLGTSGRPRIDADAFLRF